MLESKQKQKEGDYCKFCKASLTALIAIKRQKIFLFKSNDHWEAECSNNGNMIMLCPYCHSEIEFNELKTKKVIF
ncbi:MAG: hypothetical protein ABIL24_08340 [candidate division WOR-3 bacterium]